MPSIKIIKLLPYQPKLVFDLVMDIESYPEFVPWCVGARVLSKNSEIMPSPTSKAELVLDVKGMRYSYTSLIKCTSLENGYQIDINSEQNAQPLKYLRNNWLLRGDDRSTEIVFNLDFKMQSFILEKAVGLVIDKAAQKIMHAFINRLAQIKE